MRIVGAILAGGSGRRMGGGDKCLLELGVRPMLDTLLERLRPQVSAVAINANGDPRRFAEWGLPVIGDRGGAGPLAGVLAAMAWAADGAGASHLLTVAGDTPFLPPDFAALLSGSIDGPDVIAVAESPGGRHPVAALWPISLAAGLARHLAEGDFRVGSFIDRHAVRAVRFEGTEGIDPFFNVNTPRDLDIARRALLGIARMRQVIGIAGWKNSGKTTLAIRLVAALRARGLAVSTIKHAHHDFDIDHPDTDSRRHREAGAGEVAVVSAARWATIREFGEGGEAPFAAIVGSLAPCDVILVEGYKREHHRKIEVRRGAAKAELPPEFANVIAIASDRAISGQNVPLYSADDIEALADLVQSVCRPPETVAF